MQHIILREPHAARPQIFCHIRKIIQEIRADNHDQPAPSTRQEQLVAPFSAGRRIRLDMLICYAYRISVELPLLGMLIASCAIGHKTRHVSDLRIMEFFPSTDAINPTWHGRCDDHLPVPAPQSCLRHAIFDKYPGSQPVQTTCPPPPA